MASVNLSAHAYWTPDPTFTSYLNYGAGTSEVPLIQIAQKSTASTVSKPNWWRLQLKLYLMLTRDWKFQHRWKLMS